MDNLASRKIRIPPLAFDIQRNLHDSRQSHFESLHVIFTKKQFLEMKNHKILLKNYIFLTRSILINEFIFKNIRVKDANCYQWKQNNYGPKNGHTCSVVTVFMLCYLTLTLRGLTFFYCGWSKIWDQTKIKWRRHHPIRWHIETKFLSVSLVLIDLFQELLFMFLLLLFILVIIIAHRDLTSVTLDFAIRRRLMMMMCCKNLNIVPCFSTIH